MLLPCVVNQGCGEVALLPGQVTRLSLYKERKQFLQRKKLSTTEKLYVGIYGDSACSYLITS
jgi:hypothetical protein